MKSLNSTRRLLVLCIVISMSSPLLAALFGSDIFFLVDDLHGLPKESLVDWRGALVGKIKSLGMERGKHRVELDIEAQYFNNMHADIRFSIDPEAKRVHLTGGDSESFPKIEKGSQISQEASPVVKGAVVTRNQLNVAMDGVRGFLRGIRGPRVQDPLKPPLDPSLGSEGWGDWVAAGTDFSIHGEIVGLTEDSPVVWQGGYVGKVVKIGCQNSKFHADVRLFSGYRGKIFSDARFILEPGSPATLKIVGGTEESAGLLKKGGILPPLSAGEAGERAGTALRNWVLRSSEAAKEAFSAMQEREVQRATQEESANGTPMAEKTQTSN
jgi:hypothetical protein